MDRKAEVALVQTALTAILWGTSFPVTSLGLKTGLDPRTFVFLRFAIAAPLMMATSRLMGRNFVPLLRSRPIWIVGLLNATGFFCQYIGQQYTSASVAALLINLSVIFAAVGSALFLKERFGGFKVAGVTLAVVGTVLVTTNGNLAAVGGNQLFGEGLYLVGAATWGGYIVYAKEKTDSLGWDPIAAAAGIVTVTAVFLLPFALLAGSGGVGGETPIFAIAFTAVLNTALPFILYQQGLRYLTATASAVVLMLEIVVALLISVAFLGEALTLSAWVGAGAVLVSIALVSRVGTGGKSLTVQQTDVSPAGQVE